MKNKLLKLVISGFFLFRLFNVLDAQIPEPFTGKWKFECPDAPDGFNTGIIEIKTDTVFTQYSSFTYKFPSTWVKVSNDTLIFHTDVNGENVISRLSTVFPDKLTGSASTVEGSSLLLLTKRND